MDSYLDRMHVSRIDKALDAWKAQLIDLSRRNRLLYFKKDRSIQIEKPEPERLFEAMVQRGQPFEIPFLDDGSETNAVSTDEELTLRLQALGGDDSVPQGKSVQPRPRSAFFLRAYQIQTNRTTKQLRSLLYRMYRRARTAWQEQGIHVLYIAFGLLEWTESDTSTEQIYSPLLLLPVSLSREYSLGPYQVEPSDEEPVLNPALRQKLKQDFDIELSDLEENNQLSDYLEGIKTKFPKGSKWRVISEAFLDVFTFAKYSMFQDIENNRKKFASHPILRVIAGEEDRLPDISTDIPSTEWIEEYQVPKTTFQVLDADESQQVAIEAVKRGTNLVIQGPPGTGKSQTITNIIAESLAQGKKVLFVSEKMAALEVVARRLEEVKLREFCLPMHNRDVNRREIVDELNRALFSEDEISVGHLEGLHSQLYETGCIT